jgi:basic membrane protein A
MVRTPPRPPAARHRTGRTPLVATSALALLLGACGEAPDDSDAEPTPDAAASFLGCMVSDSGGINDRSFNASAWQGLQDAHDEFGIQVKFVESTTDADYTPNVNQLVAADCGIIVTVGFKLGDATRVAAQANPDERFAIVDDNPDGDPGTKKLDPIDNVKPLLFDTAQASFLAGYLAAGVSQSGTVGTFGGEQLPSVTIFMDGFVDGVAYHNETKGTDVTVVGWDKKAQKGSFTGDFEKVDEGKRLSETLIQQGADVILPVAGKVGQGAAAAALASGGKANIMWVDADGYESLPAEYRPLVITSVLKQIDTAVTTATKEALDDQFTSTAFVGTLANDGVGLAPFHDWDAKIPPELKAGVEQLRADIIAGTVTVESAATPQA